MSSFQLSDRMRSDNAARFDAEKRERFSRSFEPAAPRGLIEIELEPHLHEMNVAPFDAATPDTPSGIAWCAPGVHRV